MTDPGFTLEIDLDGDGTFETGDDVIGEARAAPSVTFRRGRDGDRVITPPYAGILEAVLDNRTKQSDPSSGVTKGRKVRFREDGSFDGTARTLWSGILDQPQRQRSKFDSVAKITAYGELSRVAGRTCPPTQLYEDIRTDEALEVILDAIGHDAPRDFDEGQTTLNYFWLGDSSGAPDAWAKMIEVFNAEGPGAQLYEEGDGTIVFRNRHSLLTDSRSTSAQATVSDQSATLAHRNITYDDGLLSTINYAEVEVNVRSVGSEDTVWTYSGGNITVAPGATVVVNAVIPSGTIVKEAQAPTTGDGDYTVVSGSGTITLDRTSGGIIPISIEAGASGFAISGLQLRAKPITVASTQLLTTTDPPTDEALRSFTRPISKEIDASFAQSLADAIPAWWGSGRASVRDLEIVGTRNNKTLAQLDAQIGDRITITDAANELSAVDFWLMDMKYEVIPSNPRVLRTFWYCEIADTNVYATWDNSLWDTGIWGF